ncbi:hypothetical protein CSHISOI_07272 [Colletotrichum shisoi]|uniref:Uncharacterized protein n=1 Tax=Colletotrichum shisoi TaxID=2078593 RepID=A0A5Q4BMI0_9PEZI|nr:hypothetical protein CSHISOI_07272 [Colletotrichum shisoi]
MMSSDGTLGLTRGRQRA